MKDNFWMSRLWPRTSTQALVSGLLILTLCGGIVYLAASFTGLSVASLAAGGLAVLCAGLAVAIWKQFAGLHQAKELIDVLLEHKQHTRILGIAVDRTDKALIITDARGRILWVNAGFERLTGFSSEEAFQKKPSELLHGPESDPEVVLQMRTAIANGEEFFVELINYNKSKGSYWARVEVEPVHDDDQQLTNFIALVWDISERKHAEKLALEKEDSLRRHHQALRQIACSERLFDGEHREALHVISKISSAAIHVSRVSIWLFDNTRKTLFCQSIYGSEGTEHGQGTMIKAHDFPRYFSLIESGGLVSVPDAVNDPRTSELTEQYLKPHEVVSLLEVPIRSNGRLIGLLSHEHRGEPREWTLEEENFVTAISSLISLVMEANNRRGVEKSLERHTESIRQHNSQIESDRNLDALIQVSVLQHLSEGSTSLRASTAKIMEHAALLFQDPGEGPCDAEQQAAFQDFQAGVDQLLSTLDSLLYAASNTEALAVSHDPVHLDSST